MKHPLAFQGNENQIKMKSHWFTYCVDDVPQVSSCGRLTAELRMMCF